MKSILISGLLFGILASASAQPVFVKDSLDIYVNREMNRWNIPAVAVAIVKDGKIVACKGYGTTESNGAKKVDENTLFQIASNSKAFTGTALAMLDARKKISLDDKATKWLPYFSLKDPYASKEATVRDLLCHRIGFQTFQSDFLNWNCNLTRKEIIEGMKNVTPMYSFRSRWGYSNSAFLAAGEVIKAATDTTWDDFVKYNFFNPLNMTRSSTYNSEIVKDKNAAVPYTILKNKLTKLSYANVDNLGPAASINSCVKDMSNWLMCQLDSGKFNGKRVIPYEAIRTTRTPHTIAGRGGNNPDFPSNHFNLYGLGWGIKDYFGKAMYEHTGGADGFVTSVCLFPEEKLGIVVLTNTDVNGLFLALREQIMLAYFNQPYVNLSAADYKGYEEGNKQANEQIAEWEKKTSTKNNELVSAADLVGTYINEVYGEVQIVRMGSTFALKFSHHPQATGELNYMSDDTFMCTYTYATWGIQLLKVKVENGTVKSLIVKVNDFVDYQSYEFVKK
ncbi:MAG: serine hydrolase [Bacteroidetes bacterium]|jgi:CubicO group peptidase (beta-lactamase class C family)|nr:serine hydrolase [Bacteroidota bacterium]